MATVNINTVTMDVIDGIGDPITLGDSLSWRTEGNGDDAMTDQETLDRLADDLQSTIDQIEAELFSGTTLEEARHPSNLGPMKDADAIVHRTGSCGDSMEVFIKVDGDRLVEMTFVTDGCGATMACGSMLTKMAKGRTLDEIMAFRDQDLIDRLDGLPEENLHCARLAVGTLHGAVHAVKGHEAD